MYAELAAAWDSLKKKGSRFIVLKPLFLMSRERKIALERKIRGREQFQKLRKADCVVVSFGKSGRTWLRVLMSRVYQTRYGLKENVLFGFDNLHRHNAAIPKIFFTHDNYLKDFTGNTDSKVDYYGKKVVLLVRHPGDVAVSQYFQWRYRMRANKKALNDYPDHGADIEAADFVLDHEAGLSKVIGFMNNWARDFDKVGEVFIIKYEDLRKNPESTLKELMNFVGIDATPAEIAEAVRFASFDNMRRLEEQAAKSWFGGGRLKPKDKTDKNSFKTRKGEVGGWRNQFAPVQVAAIEQRIRDELHEVYAYAPRTLETAPLATAAKAAG